MHYGGFKHYIDGDSQKMIPVLPEWCRHLEWSKQNGQILPSPWVEITRDEWLLLGICDDAAPVETFYDGMNIPDEPEWFGGWSCYTEVKPDYGIIVAKMHFSKWTPTIQTHDHHRPVQGKGIIIDRDDYTSYVLRFFKIGCNHQWIAVPEESRMCYHVSRCEKCGQKRAIDSSG